MPRWYITDISVNLSGTVNQQQNFINFYSFISLQQSHIQLVSMINKHLKLHYVVIDMHALQKMELDEMGCKNTI
jgi:hypothetical protein